jgi:hypothetical protein
MIPLPGAPRPRTVDGATADGATAGQVPGGVVCPAAKHPVMIKPMEPRGRLLSGHDLRRLILLRRRIRDEIVGLPRDLQHEVLRALERARHQRLHGTDPPRTPPQMTAAEILREIKWRIDAASLTELNAAAWALDRVRRKAAVRTRRAAERESRF